MVYGGSWLIAIGSGEMVGVGARVGTEVGSRGAAGVGEAVGVGVAAGVLPGTADAAGVSVGAAAWPTPQAISSRHATSAAQV
jgi:hypothetical protein